MRIGIFAKTFPGAAPLDVFRAAASAGYGSVQYNMACSGLGALPLSVSDEAAGEVRRAAEETGVAVAAVSATYNMIHPVAAEREAGRRSFEAIAAKAHRMGTRLLTVCTGSRDAEDQWRHHPGNASDAAWAEMLEECRRLVAIAERHDVWIGVEPEHANVVSSAAKARRLLDDIGGDRVRIVFDPANLVEREGPEERRRIVSEAVGLLKDRIALAHAKDRTADGGFAAAGKGAVDFPHFVSALRAAGFDGDLVTHGLAAADARDVAVFLGRMMRGGAT
jgi:sugar phosphate isomerase/epimerase